MDTLLMYHRGRGKSRGYPPNCIKTIEWAVENGAEGIEYDVVAAKSGSGYKIAMVEPGLIEEHGLDIDDLEWSDLEQIDFGNEKTGECEVAELTEVLDVIDQEEVKQQIHIKGENPETVPTLIEELEDLENISATSFDLEVLQRVREREPQVKLGWIVKPDSESGSEGTQDLTQKVTSNPGALPFYTDEELEQIKQKAEENSIDLVILCAPKIENEKTIEFFRKNGFEVGAWGVGSNLEVAKRMIDLNIDRFTIDSPEQLDN